MPKVAVVVIGLFLLLAARNVFAQNLPNLGGVAVNVEVAGDSEAGDIVSLSGEGLKRSAAAYDINMYGVIVSAPVLSVAPKSDKTRAVMTSGIAEVKVSASEGAIKVGDFLTASDTPGVAKKAAVSGYVLGKALGNYDDAGKVGTVPVEVNIGFFEVSPNVRSLLSNILTNLNNALKNPATLTSLLKYILAFVIGTLTFVAAAFAFIKFMNTGLLALGRNPLARRTILVGMMMSGLIVAVLALAGFGVAAAIIGLWRT